MTNFDPENLADHQPEDVTGPRPEQSATTPVYDDGSPPPLRRNRDFLLLWSGQVASTIGNRVSALAYPLLVLALTGSPAGAGLTGFALGLGGFVCYLPAGALVDRWNRKRVMMIADTVRMVAVATVVTAVMVGQPSLPHLMLVAFLEGAGGVFVQLAETAALPHVVARRQMSTAVAQNQARDVGSGLVGQPVGGLLFSLSHAAPFLANAVSYLASLCSLALIRPPLQQKSGHAPRRLHVEVAEGVAWLVRQPLLRSSALIFNLCNLAFGMLPLTLIVRADQLGASPATIGAMMGLTGGGAVLGAVITPWLQRRVRESIALLAALWSSALLVAMLATLSNVAALGLVTAMATLEIPLVNVILVGYRYALTPDRLMGRVTSVIRLVSSASGPVAVLAAGILVARLGPASAFLIAAAIQGLNALLATTTPAVRNAHSTGAADAGVSDSEQPATASQGVYMGLSRPPERATSRHSTP